MSDIITPPQERLTRQALIGYFKPKSDSVPGQIGLELEKFGLDPQTLAPIAMDGPGGLAYLFDGLIRRFNWKPLIEAGERIGLTRGDSQITLEPGGQLELALPPVMSIVEARRAEASHLEELVEVSQNHPVLWSGLGVHPLARLDEIPWFLKERYRIMKTYFMTKGTLAHWMMKATSSLQINLDYPDANTAADMLKTAHYLAPILTALFAHSCFSQGTPNGFMSYRSHIWQNTDAERCGLIPRVFEPDFSIEDYVDYALSVPLFFIKHAGAYRENPGLNFSKWMLSGYQNNYPSLKDWETHLSCLFPEARLKRWIEVRSIDRHPGELGYAPAVLVRRLIIPSASRRAVQKLLDRFGFADAQDALSQAARSGLQGRYGDLSLADLSGELLKIARETFRSWPLTETLAAEDARHLDLIDEALVKPRLSAAERLLSAWGRGTSLEEIIKTQALKPLIS